MTQEETEICHQFTENLFLAMSLVITTITDHLADQGLIDRMELARDIRANADGLETQGYFPYLRIVRGIAKQIGSDYQSDPIEPLTPPRSTGRPHLRAIKGGE